MTMVNDSALMKMIIIQNNNKNDNDNNNNDNDSNCNDNYTSILCSYINSANYFNRSPMIPNLIGLKMHTSSKKIYTYYFR